MNGTGIANPLESLRNLVRPREKFLMLHIAATGASGLFIAVDEEKNLITEKLVRGIELKKFLSSPVRSITQKSWEGEYVFKSHRKVAAVADPGVATTIPIPLNLVRDREIAKEDIILSEVENLIAQAMGKMFNQCRRMAAERLGVHELDTVLVGAKGRHFRVDGNLVMNPVGFKGKKISLLLELTFTRRAIFEDLKQLFSAPEDFYFAEMPQAWLSFVARFEKLPLNFVRQEKDDSALFVFESEQAKYPVLFRERLPWQFDSLYAQIERALSVSRMVAQSLYALYLREDGMSPSLRRAFKKIVDSAGDALLEATAKTKMQGIAYFDAPQELPFDLPYRHANAAFDRIPLAKAREELGFGAIMNRDAYTDAELSRYLFPFFEMYFDKSNSEINQKLRRRLHWLAE